MAKHHLPGRQLASSNLLEGRKYFKLANKWYGAGGLRTKISPGVELPYMLAQGLGYDYHVRGYEDYVQDADHYALFKSNFKYQLMNTMIVFKKIKDRRFDRIPVNLYLTLFADVGYTWKSENKFSNSLQETLLSGYGIGLDLHTYYDRIIRLEFAMNHLNEPGLYLHFTQPI